MVCGAPSSEVGEKGRVVCGEVRPFFFPLYFADRIRSHCSSGTSGRRSGLWDTTKAETMPGNAQNAGKRLSASRSRSRSSQRN